MIAIKIAATSWFLTALLVYGIHRYEVAMREKVNHFWILVASAAALTAIVSTLVSIWVGI